MQFQLAYPDIGEERRGNTGTPGVWHFDSGVAGPAVMISALMHGNELCGAWALKAMLAAGVQPKRGSLTLVFANLSAFDRFDPARHDASRFVQEDMNRVWSADRLADGSTQERARAAELQPWVERADWLLDLHSMHEPSVPLCLTGTLPRNVALARQMGTPQHVIVDAGHRDGTRLRDYGAFGDPHGEARALLIECGFHGDPAAVDVAKDQVGRFLIAADSVDPADVPEGWIQAPLGEQRVLEVTDAVVAPSMQVSFAEPWQGMETFASAGSVIGWADEKPIVTPYDDCTLVMPSLRQLKPGVTVVRLARQYTD